MKKTRGQHTKTKTRVTTFKPNGHEATEIAPEPKETLDLGPIQIPTGEDAERALRLLAELNDAALQAKARYDAAALKAKQAKAKWDEKANALQEKLKIATHPSDLPLFDPQERELDQVKMETAAVSPPVDDVPF